MSRYLDAHGNITEQFAGFMQRLAEATQGREVTEIQARVYAEQLGDITFDRLQAAGNAHLREQKFFPGISELRQLAGEPSADDRGVLAWLALERAAETVGPYADVIFQDATAAAAVMAMFGSWPAVCELAGEGPAWGARRAEFLAAYRAARRATASAKPVRLQGTCSMQSSEALPPGTREWVGLVSVRGEAKSVQRTAQLTGGGRSAHVLPAAQAGEGISQEGEGEAGASRDRGEAGRARGGGGAGRALPADVD
jgi:hypothetical protein